jgi:hypothetical protein
MSLVQELDKGLGHNDFKATASWLSLWECRFGIKFMNISADEVSAEHSC